MLWILIVAFAATLALGSLTPEEISRAPADEAPTVDRGPVESLAIWLIRAPHGGYFKWLVAQRLGKLARAMLAFRGRHEVPSGREALDGPGWNPPREVAAYLESGLNGSFADFPQPRWPFQRPRLSPLDLDPEEAIRFIESNMEIT